MAESDLTIEILKEIRSEVRATNARLDTAIERLDVTTERLDLTVQRLDITVERLDVVESTVLDMANKQHLLLRYAKAGAERQAQLDPEVRALEPRVAALEARVGKLESK
jgi:hypothetical protein